MKKIVLDANKLYYFLYYPHVQQTYMSDERVFVLGTMEHGGSKYEVSMSYPEDSFESEPVSALRYGGLANKEAYVRYVHVLAQASLSQVLYRQLNVKRDVFVKWAGMEYMPAPIPPILMPSKETILRQTANYLSGNIAPLPIPLYIPYEDYIFLRDMSMGGVSGADAVGGRLTAINFLKDVARGGHKSSSQSFLAQPAMFYTFVQGRSVWAAFVKPKDPAEGKTIIEWQL